MRMVKGFQPGAFRAGLVIIAVLGTTIASVRAAGQAPPGQDRAQ